MWPSEKFYINVIKMKLNEFEKKKSLYLNRTMNHHFFFYSCGAKVGVHAPPRGVGL